MRRYQRLDRAPQRFLHGADFYTEMAVKNKSLDILRHYALHAQTARQIIYHHKNKYFRLLKKWWTLDCLVTPCPHMEKVRVVLTACVVSSYFGLLDLQHLEQNATDH